MIKRKFWLTSVTGAWEQKNIIWLSGVRRAGKTYLCRSIPGIKIYDCELPSARAALESPETFLKTARSRIIALDEIHKLPNPSELLKIAADYFPDILIIATGSSSLSMSRKFSDTLTDRKTSLWLTPMTASDLDDFGVENLDRRMLHGGLPPFWAAAEFSEKRYIRWMDDFWARDIQELFRVEKRYSFLKFAELVFARSGGIFEAASFTGPCEASRNTIMNYLCILEDTCAVSILRPFCGKSSAEITASPKVYGFDTGFVCAFRGIGSLRPDDRGFLWEHIVLNEMSALLQSRRIKYWRNKQGHEIDFVLDRPGKPPVAIECKYSEKEFSPRNFYVFSKLYENAEYLAVCADAGRPHVKTFRNLNVTFLNLENLGGKIAIRA